MQTDTQAPNDSGLAATPCAICECANWCSPDIRINILTGHHPSCDKGESVSFAAYRLIQDLARGMEAWAADEDGIHPDAWTAYRKAKALEGVFLDASDDEPNVSGHPTGPVSHESKNQLPPVG